MQSPKLTERILKDGDVVPFVAMTSNYGRAEFRFCCKWKPKGRRRVIETLWIYPIQQADVRHYFRVDSGFSDGLSVEAWTYKGMDEPRIWRHGWCSEHRCQFFDAYVPNRSVCFRIEMCSTLGVYFDSEIPAPKISDTEWMLRLAGEPVEDSVQGVQK